MSRSAKSRWGRCAADDGAPVADSGRRIRHLQIGFTLLLCLVLARVVAIECSQGPAFRAAAARLLEKPRWIPGVRGRILTSDGLVLAADERVASLAVHYRYLEDAPSPRWIRSQARARIPRDAPRRGVRLAQEEAWIRAYRSDLLSIAARLCGRPVDELQAQSQRIQTRVRTISEKVNSHRQQVAFEKKTPVAATGFWETAFAFGPRYVPWLFAPDDERAPPRIVIAEELDYHVLVSDVPLEVVAEVESRPEEYPGLRIVEQSRRHYPAGALAANVVGFLGAGDVAEEDRPSLVGRQGIERQYDAQLRGRDGRFIDQTDHGGRLLSTVRQREPAAGADLVLSIDARLQRIAEAQLDRAIAQSAALTESNDRPKASSPGGAIVAIDVHTGEILATASGPRYNPNVFAEGDNEAIGRVLADAGHPLFDRPTQMALPPGSVFKLVTAATLLEDPRFDPAAPFYCQGYLQQPDRLRCQIFRHLGAGHEELGLADALAQSCNVYFFHHAQQLGLAPLVRCADRLGFGKRTGVDLPGESSANLPTSSAATPDTEEWTLADTQALAIGQSRLTATPLQVARAMAAIANGGQLVQPRLIAVGDDSKSQSPAPAQSAGLSRRQINELRAGLRRAVEHQDGTAHGTLADADVAVAGKSGTAETGANLPDHAWFAGYAPAEAPRVAFVVVLEHGGGAERAALVAKDLVQAMQALGLLEASTVPDIARIQAN